MEDNSLVVELFRLVALLTGTAIPVKEAISGSAQVFYTILAQFGFIFAVLFHLKLAEKAGSQFNTSQVNPSKYNFFKFGKSSFWQVIVYALCLDIMAVFAFTMLWPGPVEGKGLAGRLAMASYQGITAVSGAGMLVHVPNFSFSYIWDHAFVLQAVLAGSLLVASIGMPVFMDLVNPMALRERLKKPDIDWRPFTKLTITSLVIFVMVMLFLLIGSGRNGIYEHYNNGEAFISALFTLVNAGTAGLQPVYPETLSFSGQSLLMLCMVLGAIFFSGKALLPMLVLGNYLKISIWEKRPDLGKIYLPCIPIKQILIRYLTISALVNLIGSLLIISLTGYTPFRALFMQLSSFSNCGWVWTENVGSTSIPIYLLQMVNMLLGSYGIWLWAVREPKSLV